MAIKGQPGEQLRMLMSAREIQDQYQPLDADREGSESGSYSSSSSSSGSSGSQGWYTADKHRGGGLESDEELWDRKVGEAWDDGLAQDIIERGVEKPVHLGRQFGSMGKPQVVGGHHRIAVMADEAPDELMPVLHHESIYAAKGSQGYRYS